MLGFTVVIEVDFDLLDVTGVLSVIVNRDMDVAVRLRDNGVPVLLLVLIQHRGDVLWLSDDEGLHRGRQTFIAEANRSLVLRSVVLDKIEGRKVVHLVLLAEIEKFLSEHGLDEVVVEAHELLIDFSIELIV